MRAWVGVLLIAVGCGGDEDDVKKDWNAYLAEHNACEVAADCAVISPGCPLGCAAAVSASDAQDAQAEADRLVARYERGGRSCAYDCPMVQPVICDSGQCAIGPADVCEGKACGDTCTTCTSGNCPAVEQRCNIDGQCVATAPECGPQRACEDNGGACTGVGDCGEDAGHVGFGECAGTQLCCVPLDACAGAEPACTDGSACYRPICFDGEFDCADGQALDDTDMCAG